MRPVTEEDVRLRKLYLGITAEDEEVLRRAHSLVVEHGADIIRRFYDWLLSHEAQRKMLSGPGILDRLKDLQRGYFERLLSGPWGADYFEDRLKVGRTHHRVGVSPEWYLGAYDRYLAIVSEVFRPAFGADEQGYRRTLEAVRRMVTLDLGLAMDAYFAAGRAELEAGKTRLADALDRQQHLQDAKQTLTDMIVHDLQNPMAGIRAFLELLGERREGLSESEGEALREALRRCDDLGQMVMNVLQVSRAESGRLQTYIENVDLALLARETAAAYRLFADSSQRRIDVEAERPVLLRSDQSLIRRILANLVRNGIRHTPRGTRILIRAESAADGGGVLSVVDTGQGIPEQAIPLLFQHFAATSLRAAGLRVDTGLGLAFCGTAAAALGGTITAASDGKTGTTIRLTLPAAP